LRREGGKKDTSHAPLLPVHCLLLRWDVITLSFPLLALRVGRVCVSSSGSKQNKNKATVELHFDWKEHINYFCLHRFFIIITDSLHTDPRSPKEKTPTHKARAPKKKSILWPMR
jgi:hypothetical protein